MSRHNTVAAFFASCLGGIRKVHGYNCDAGLKIYRGKQQAPESTECCATLFEDEETVLEQKKSKSATVRMPYVVSITGPCESDNPNIAAHELADDVCRAIWSVDYSADLLRGLFAEAPAYAGRQILPRPPGQNIVTVLVKFNAKFAFNPGKPEGVQA